MVDHVVSSKRNWRTLIRVESVTSENPRKFSITIPAWDPNKIITLSDSILPEIVRLSLTPGYRCYARVDLSVESEDELVFEDWEVGYLLAMNDRIELPHGRYTLVRERDGIGDSGHLLEAIPTKENYDGSPFERNVLKKGFAVRCGSIYARSYSEQDWWMTTPIKEFLDISKDKSKIRFETVNGSVYTITVG